MPVDDGIASGDEAGDRIALRGVTVGTAGAPVILLRLTAPGDDDGEDGEAELRWYWPLLLSDGIVTLYGVFAIARICAGLAWPEGISSI